jgi:transcriptional regulator with XRE-family HTH domain
MIGTQEFKPNGAHRKGEHVKLLIDTLKRLFRARGLTYRDIAAGMSVSEVTVKRWFSSQNMTLRTVEELCDLANITLADLMELATRDSDPRLKKLSMEQEQALAESTLMSFIFALLLNGWSAEELRRECEIDEALLVRYLVRLDRLRLIDLLPGNIVRLLTKRDIEWRRDGPVRKMFSLYVKQYLDDMDFNDPEALWVADSVRLSKDALVRLQGMFIDFQRNVRALADADRSQQGGDKSWYSVLAAACPLVFKFEGLVEHELVRQA